MIEEEDDFDEHASSFCSDPESHAFCESCQEHAHRSQPRPLKEGPAPLPAPPGSTLTEIPEDAGSQTSGDETRAFLPRRESSAGQTG